MEKRKQTKIKEKMQSIFKKNALVTSLLLLEIALIIFLIGMFSNNAIAGIAQNVTVITRLDIGNSGPEIGNISVEGGNVFDLIQNASKTMTIYAIARDYNGEDDISVVNMSMFDPGTSSLLAADDNNNHYTNSSCIIDKTYGDALEVNVTCSLDIWYYANNASWNISMNVYDIGGLTGFSSARETISSLLSLGVPDSIDYGTVNATAVSDEKIINLSNFGNMMTNITVEGYAVNRYDNLSMNCTAGSMKNISIYYEKYNLTASNTSTLNLTQFNSKYVNLTSAPVMKRFNLMSRQNDTQNEAINATYWRIYVPTGVAGSCSGNIVFSAIRGTGS